MYILLEDGMIIKASDEVMDDNGEFNWHSNIGLCIGQKYISSFHLPIRRKINTIEELVTAYNTSEPGAKDAPQIKPKDSPALLHDYRSA